MLNRIKFGFLPIIGVLAVCLLLTSCSTTDIVRDWNDDSHRAEYHNIFVIGISDSQQNRRIFENYLVGDLGKSGIMAEPSYKYINSKTIINRESVVKAVNKLNENGADVDAVLVTYLVATDSKPKYRDSPVGTSYSGSEDTNMMSSTLIATRGRYSSDEIIELKTDLYDVASRQLVWSIQTRSVAPESIDEVITEVSGLIRNQLHSDDRLGTK